MSTTALSAVGCTGRETGIALPADLLVAVVLGSEHLQRGLNDAATEAIQSMRLVSSGSMQSINPPEDQVESGLLLNIVVAESTTILKLLAGEDQALLVGGDTKHSNGLSTKLSPTCDSKNSPLLVLDLSLDIVDGVGRLHLKGDSLAREGLDEDLHLVKRTGTEEINVSDIGNCLALVLLPLTAGS